MSTNWTATSEIFNSPIYVDEHMRRDKIESLLKESFRPVNKLITEIQICLVFWVLGQCFRHIRYFSTFLLLFIV